MNILKILLFSVGLLISQSIGAQHIDESGLEKFNEVKMLVRKGKTKDAFKKLDKLIKKFPQFSPLYLQKAGMFYDANDKIQAKELFEKAIAIDPAIDKEAFHALGTVCMDLVDYSCAQKAFGTYLTKIDANDPKREAVDYWYRTALFRDQAIKQEKPIIFERLDSLINTSNSEYLPAFTLDDEVMFFTRNERYNEDLYSVSKDSSGNEMVAPLDGLNTKQNEGGHAISADGSTLFFTGCDRPEGMGGCDIYVSRKTKGKWSIPHNLGSINSGAWDAQPFLSADGKTLYFSSNRLGTYGSYDLWSTEWKDGKWETPKNLGSAINTKGKEESPFLHADGKTLYFRSDYHIGMGSFDIFKSTLQEDGTWSEPVNLGASINTAGSEGALFVRHDGMYAYFASDREMQKNLDIYRFVLPMEVRPDSVTYVKAIFQDGENQNSLNPLVEIVDLGSNKNVLKDKASNGQLLTPLHPNKTYALVANLDGYALYSAHFEPTGQSVKNPYILQVSMLKIKTEKEGAATILHNIFFETGSYALTSASDFELDQLAKMLKENPTLRIKIQGHTDNVGAEQENIILSTNRANAVVAALVKRGIGQSRLEAEGKGESTPLDTNDTEEGRSRNRRTTFVLLK